MTTNATFDPAVRSAPGDLESAERSLLARHAPVLRFDRRELFRPTKVDGYVDAARLVDHGGTPMGPVDVAALDDRWSPGTSLRFISDADRGALTREQIRSTRRTMLSSRLGRVGLFGRLIDALFLLSVWIRPTTPRRTTAAAAMKAERLGLHDHPACYGRVVRAGEWIVLHYAYFYAMNDWRTSYGGLNDHEADWEQAWIYCDPHDETPVWIATSSHDLSGSDLRRHWSDPEVKTEDGRPHLYVGAGSHALFFRPGDYVTRIDIPALRWLLRAQRALQRALRIRDDADVRGLGPALGVPFIDSTSSTGTTVAEWDVVPMNGLPWIERYRGLWGVDTGDPLQGERGPSGPKFDRDGEIRASWADPLGFAGLHGTPPPSALAARVNIEKLEKVIAEIDDQIRHRARLLPLAHQTNSSDEMASESERLTELLRHRCELDELRVRVANGQWRGHGVRDHLRHPAVAVEAMGSTGWLLAAWAAISVPALLVAVASVLLLERLRLGGVALALALSSLPIEYIARREFKAVLRLLTIEVAAVAFFAFAFGLMLSASRYAFGATLVVAAVSLLLFNGSELRSVVAGRRQLR